MPAGIVGLAVVAGILLAFGLRQRRLGPGLAYMLLIPVVITLAYVSAWLVDPLTVTMNRVKRIDQAVERYHQEQGSYPSSLAQLMPDQILFKLPQLTGRGQVWCYQGGVDYYRLGYAYYQRYYEWGPSILSRKSGSTVPLVTRLKDTGCAISSWSSFNPLEDSKEHVRFGKCSFHTRPS